MNYPLISEYIEAIKSAEDNFEELSYLRPALGDDGLPVMSAGGFSVVFKMKDEQSGKFYAVKCFTKEQEGRSESYKLIADELEFVSSNYLTAIRFLEKELFVDTDQTTETEFPVLLMDWVDGIPMDKYIQKNIKNQYALEMLAFRFSKLAIWLLTQPFAHGDLKPDNILVKEDGSIVIVDYDGMYVPTMRGQKARELGSPNYRHPKRTIDDFDRHIDDFPLATICLSLKAIALKPELFTNSIGECGLFLNEFDFRNLKASKTIHKLICLLPDNDLCSLLGVFLIVLSHNKLEVLANHFFTLEKPIKINGKKQLYEGKKNETPDEMTYNLACTHIKNKEYKEAYEIFRTIALSPYGQNGLGICYVYGYYVEKNYQTAAYWFKNAAHQGLSVAEFNYGNCYYNGIGMTYHKGTASYWYKRAAEQGLEIAKEMLRYEGSSSEPEWKKFEYEQNVKRRNKIASIFILESISR